MYKKRDFTLFIKDILTSIEKIQRYTSKLSFEEFSNNDMIIDAVIRNFEIIGEAVKKIPDEIKKQYPDIEWKESAGFRDILIHDYFGIDLELVWETIQNNIPTFKKKIEDILKIMEPLESSDNKKI